MLDIRRIREKTEEIREGLRARGAGSEILEEVLELDRQRREAVNKVESLKEKRNKVSKEIGKLRKSGEDTTQIQAETRELGREIGKLDEKVRAVDEELAGLMLMIPNVPHPGVPPGLDESASRFVREWGEKRKFDFEPKSHVELGESLGILDFARGAKVAGAGFPMYVGLGARLERALIQFMLDLHTREHGYTEISPPFVCNSRAMTGTGQLPKMAEDMYQLPKDDLYLIPTAEVPVTNCYADEIIEQVLPIYLTAYTPCWRREAGAAGKETRGLIRVHQFDKVEMVKFVSPGSSCDELESLVANAEDVLQRLELPYRVMELCAGDISFAAAKCYDIELWAPGQNAWLEVSSCSNFEDFQARRAGIRYRDDAGKVQFVHTLNGSGTALSRLVVAVMENGQQADGSVVLPNAIVPYMGDVSCIGPA